MTFFVNLGAIDIDIHTVTESKLSFMMLGKEGNFLFINVSPLELQYFKKSNSI